MNLTLLIDLDDTLLSNDIERFQREYLKALSLHLKDQIQPELMIRELLSGTKAMVSKDDPRQTLEEVFDGIFYPGVKTPKKELISSINKFYEHEFGRLKYLTSEKIDSIQFIKNALAQGCDIVIATNPLFPRSATIQRVSWAGLAEYIPQFKCITTYESFHFSKPNPAYYSEILMQLGWPDKPAVVIGNDIDFDIKPALSIGLPAFLIKGGDSNPNDGYSPSGSFVDANKWLENIDINPVFDFNFPGMLLACLKSTPAATDTLSRGLDQKTLEFKKSGNEWSIIQIICHFRDVDREVNLPRLKRVLSENDPFIPAESTDSWALDRNYESQNCFEAINDFLECRIEIINILAGLSQDQWSLSARHAIFGRTTLIDLFKFVITHDITHIRQILENIRLAQNG